MCLTFYEPEEEPAQILKFFKAFIRPQAFCNKWASDALTMTVLK